MLNLVTTATMRLRALACSCLLLAGAPSWADTDLPRYWPKVGQELTYRTTSEFSTAEGQAMGSESTWQVWVVRQNSDGTWRLIFRHASTVQGLAGATKPGAKSPSAKPAPKAAARPTAGKAAPAKSGPARPAPGKGSTAKPPARQPQAPPTQPASFEQVAFAYCDLSADGAVASNPTLGFQFEPRQLLPKLPVSKKEIDKGWTDFDKATQTKILKKFVPLL
ncbi:MAG TPA: hypothetical protein PK867_15115, partial [Pirellulales bacterium]|nr:hypothetical protein [Pirellulales bacterium]